MCCINMMRVTGWSCFVNVENKECLQLNVKVQNKLVSVIGKALKMDEFAV